MIPESHLGETAGRTGPAVAHRTDGTLLAGSVTVIIPNWNGLAHLHECLTCLREQTLVPERILLVDNDSADESCDFVAAHFPEVEIVSMPLNGGFSYAVNEGIRRTVTEYVVLLNNDTHAEPDCLEQLVRALEASPAYAMATPRMVLYYDRNLMNAAGDVYDLSVLAGRNRGLRKSIERYDARVRVFGACAGAALYRRSLFDDIGIFDEGFFLMSEDTDINLRALIAGHKCLYVPAAWIFHKMRATIDEQPSEKMSLLAMRNEVMVVAKDLPYMLIVWALLIYPWRIFRSTFPLRPANWHLIAERLRLLPQRIRVEREGFSTGWSKRRDVYSRRKVPDWVIMRWLVWGVGRAL